MPMIGIKDHKLHDCDCYYYHCPTKQNECPCYMCIVRTTCKGGCEKRKVMFYKSDYYTIIKQNIIVPTEEQYDET